MKTTVKYQNKEYAFRVKEFNGQIHVTLDGDELLVSQTGNFTLKFENVARRIFVLKDDTGSFYAATRHVETRYNHNFRDLGGYITNDGKTVKYNKIYRSSCLHNMEPDYLSIVKSIGFKKVIDLRSTHEVKTRPNDYEVRDITKNIHADKFLEHNIHFFFSHLKFFFTKKYPDNYMCFYYRTIFKSTSGLKQVFQEILSGDNPKVFHCHSGKDRTGVISYLLLYSLGVREEDRLTDYLETNDYCSRTDALIIEQIRKTRFLRKKHQDKMLGLFTIKKIYLDTFLDSVNNKYGNLDNYIASGIGLDEAAIKKLKTMYLD